MTAFPTQQPDQGATNMPNPNPSATEDGRAVSSDLSPEAVAALVDLARVLDPDACDPPAKTLPIGDAAEVWRRQDAALLTARRVWEAHYRLVSEDDTTVERVARAMHLAGCQCGMSFDDHQVSMLNDFGEEDEGYVVMARAAVRALRQGGAE